MGESLLEDYNYSNTTKMDEILTERQSNFIDYKLTKSDITCLDVGSGSGRFSLPLYLKGVDIFAVDHSLISLIKLHEKEKNIPAIMSDAQKLPFKDSFFDVIIGIQLIHYLNPDLFLSECIRILKDGGYLLLTLGNRRSYKGFYQKLNSKLMRKTHHTTFYRLSYGEIKEKLIKNGFYLECSHGFNWLPVKGNSNSNLLSYFMYLERLFRLHRLPSISPWIFIIAKKVKH